MMDLMRRLRTVRPASRNFRPQYVRRRGRIAVAFMVSDHGRHVMSSSPVPLKTRRVGRERCTLNLSRAQASSRWCGVVVSRGRYQLRCRPRHGTMAQNDEAKSPRVAEQCVVNIHSLVDGGAG
ncbi:uncharacterized protein TNCV_4383751 [Trichonephila clavipes]|nr:uncharacterized protein TNCV_4383751 [Trichonephila clavipes]